MMDLRSFPDGLPPAERCNERRKRIEQEWQVHLHHAGVDAERIGSAEEKNCEQMFGHVPVPVGLAGPLRVHWSTQEDSEIVLPLATTEGALVASVNRGCKALSNCEGVRVTHVHHGTSRTIAFRSASTDGVRSSMAWLQEKTEEWTRIGEETSNHLSILSHTIDTAEDHLFLTLFCDTDEAMGMNMVTIAAQAIGEWVAAKTDLAFVTVAGNVDSDKKPSRRVHERGRGYEVTATAMLPETVITSVLKTTPAAMLAVARAKLELGSELAGAIGHNLHAANVVAALYLATGQDAAHVVEGSLSDTSVAATNGGISVTVRLSAIMVGLRGGGTGLPAQSECLQLLLKPTTKLHRRAQLAESIGAAVLAGEVSLLAAQSSHALAKAHRELGR